MAKPSDKNYTGVTTIISLQSEFNAVCNQMNIWRSGRKLSLAVHPFPPSLAFRRILWPTGHPTSCGLISWRETDLHSNWEDYRRKGPMPIELCSTLWLCRFYQMGVRFSKAVCWRILRKPKPGFRGMWTIRVGYILEPKSLSNNQWNIIGSFTKSPLSRQRAHRKLSRILKCRAYLCCSLCRIQIVPVVLREWPTLKFHWNVIQGRSRLPYRSFPPRSDG